MFGENFYSRLVTWLKIILPIAALGLLSTLFLLSNSVDPTETIPYAEIDLAERARDQGVTEAYFSGATESGDLISFAAEAARPDPNSEQLILADKVKSWVNLSSGTFLRFRANHGVLNEPGDLANLTGKVLVTSSIGYTIRTESLDSAMRKVWAETRGPIQADGPPGRFSAGKMALRVDPDTNDAHLLFTNGVKLVYDPKKNRD